MATATAAEVSVYALRALYLDLCTDLCTRGGRVMSQPYTGEPTSPLLPPLVIPKPPSLMPVYMAIALGGMLIGGGLAIVISLLRPPPIDNSTLISTMLTGVGVAVLQALNFIKSNQAAQATVQNGELIGVLHKSVNSGFEEFARLIRLEARAEGVKETEAKQFDAAAIEARITAAVDAAVAKVHADETARADATHETTKEVAQAVATKIVSDMESVDVATIQPPAVDAIVDAVRAVPPAPEEGA